MVEVDLHLHTTLSDGRLTPTALIQLCARRGLKVISITDHDSTEALPEVLQAALSFPQLQIISGVELSTDVADAEIHVLGYFVDYLDPGLQQLLKQFREDRQDRARRMVQKLNELGLKLAWDRVVELAEGAAIGRPHIAQAMVEAGYVRYPRDAFDRYLGRNGPAYVERTKLTPAEAIEALVENGALPVMAHPTYSAAKADRDDVHALRKVLEELKEAGLVGMEVYYGDYSAQQVEHLASLAAQLGLVACGGSDYHASGNPGEPEPGTVGPPMESVKALESLRAERLGRHSKTRKARPARQ